MPETYTPKTWVDGPAGGTPIIATELNRIEQGVESMDDRTAALEAGILTPVSITYAASISPDATTGNLFRVTATGDLTVAAITGAVDGQAVTLQVLASGADRVVAFAIANTPTSTIRSGTVGTWTFRYYSTGSLWSLDDTSTTAGPVTLTDGATVALDAATGSLFRLTATASRTILAPTNPSNGQRITIQHVASGGTWTLTLTTGSAGAFAFGTTITALTATTTALTDYIDCIYSATAARWRIVGYNKGFA